ncbi:putative membrane protein [Hyphomicrobium facile]|uniref:Putative membrane protein n=2 Tax=Hyphomicrobium facile TaxID=51670 RepID=A0A1I7NJ12_9HYPH|nr:putative membrane protein [Hyphomicrobium facile]
MRAILAIIAMGFALPVLAADVPRQTKDFVSNATVGNKFEIDTSELALKYGKSPEVQNFAHQMITDHTKAGEDLKKALEEAKIEPPENALDMTHEAKYAKLRLFTTKNGFDSAYAHDQLKAHEDAVAKFKDYAANGPTPQVKAFAVALLPTLEHHLAMAKDLNEKMRSHM